MCIINNNHIMYHFWDMKRDGQKFLSFWTIFSLLPPLMTQKIKILKKWKWYLDMSSSYTCIRNHNHMMYASWDMECDRQNFLSFWIIFCPFTHRPPIVHKGVPVPSTFQPPTPWPGLLPFLKSSFPLPSFLFHPLLKYFTQLPPPSCNPFLP